MGKLAIIAFRTSIEKKEAFQEACKKTKKTMSEAIGEFIDAFIRQMGE